MARAHRLTVVVPTYRRAAELARLLGELGRQQRRPGRLIVVDGEGGDPRVRAAVAEAAATLGCETLLVPSTRANLPFQRYLGRLLCTNGDRLVCFDDDLLLPDPKTLGELERALDRAAAATCEVAGPGLGRRPWAPTRWRARFIRRRPGALTAAGQRHPPAPGPERFVRVEWLRGGAMAFRAEALPPEEFPLEMFALAESGVSAGEDLALALVVRGPIVLARRVVVEHPGEAPSRALPGRARARGFGAAYSRRLLNDLFRGGRPSALDRGALALGWAAGAVQAAFTGGPFLFGYFEGALHGILRPPCAARLAPGVDWDDEARRSLARVERFAGGNAPGIEEAPWLAAAGC